MMKTIVTVLLLVLSGSAHAQSGFAPWNGQDIQALNAGKVVTTGGGSFIKPYYRQHEPVSDERSVERDIAMGPAKSTGFTPWAS